MQRCIISQAVNRAGARWEVQLKGAGLTPFSRTADGRKVLRSSIREFLASEAMHALVSPCQLRSCCRVGDAVSLICIHRQAALAMREHAFPFPDHHN